MPTMDWQDSWGCILVFELSSLGLIPVPTTVILVLCIQGVASSQVWHLLAFSGAGKRSKTKPSEKNTPLCAIHCACCRSVQQWQTTLSILCLRLLQQVPTFWKKALPERNSAWRRIFPKSWKGGNFFFYSCVNVLLAGGSLHGWPECLPMCRACHYYLLMARFPGAFTISFAICCALFFLPLIFLSFTVYNNTLVRVSVRVPVTILPTNWLHSWLDSPHKL